MKRKVSPGLICRLCCIQHCCRLWRKTLRCAVSDATSHRNVKLKKMFFVDFCCDCFFAIAEVGDNEDVKQEPVTGDSRAVSSVCLLVMLLDCYVGGSISFRPDIQRPRQMQNALRDT